MVLCLVLVVCSHSAWTQGTYYDGIDTSKATFVTDLHNLIYPHTRITYDNFDETNVANFASYDTTGGQRAVVCVYTGYIYVYTPPFTWGTMSREHTWCQSWMPSVDASGFTSRPEYSDQFHIFPVHQNNANGRRSNHPLGIVNSITYQFLDGKLGIDSLGHTVYEPRDAQKGASARALLYMAVCYNGVDGYDWTFNHLNTVILPDSLHEAAEDPGLLISWAKEYPPDSSERARNEFVDSLQGNRNPFIDHPEYLDLIDFNSLTKKGTATLSTEPTNYPTSFAIGTTGSSSLQVTWVDADAGTQAPSGYLLLAKTSDSFSAPTDGSAVSNDTNLGDGSGAMNVSYPGAGSYTFTGLSSGTTYYFRIYSYNGSGSQINYKTDGTVPSTNGTTTASSSHHLVIYEVYGGGGNSGATYKNDYIVLYNPTSSSVSVSGWSVQYASATGSSWSVTSLTGSVPADCCYLVQEAAGAGGTTDLPTPDATGTITMSSAAGKVALCNTTTAITGTNPSGSQIIDFVGYGTTANGYEGSGPTPAPSNTTSVARINHGQDTDDNANDFAAGSPNPQNSTVALPVELTSLTAMCLNNDVTLRWQTATESNNGGWEVERRNIVYQVSDNRYGEWSDLGFVTGAGTSTSPLQYSFIDRNVNPGTYEYRLNQIDRGGSSSVSSTVRVDVEGVPTEFRLSPNYPNPFNPSTTMEFQLPSDGRAILELFDVFGREVATLVDKDLKAGVTHRVTIDASGLSSGVYLVRLRFADRSAVQKIMVLK